MIKKLKIILVVLAVMVQYGFVSAQEQKAPAYPLITHDPYFSIWSTTDLLSASTTKHWTGTNHSLIGLISVDGTLYRFLGNKELQYHTIVPTSDEKYYETAYTETAPGNDWMNLSFDDSKWKKGIAPFGDNKTVAKTLWLTKDIWMRRTFSLDNTDLNKLFLKLHNDDNVEVFFKRRKNL